MLTANHGQWSRQHTRVRTGRAVNLPSINTWIKPDPDFREVLCGSCDCRKQNASAVNYFILYELFCNELINSFSFNLILSFTEST